MGQQLPPEDLELYRRCDEILHYIWDPIGVAGAPSARDEYYSYLPLVFSYVRDNASVDAIVVYLDSIVEEHMGIGPDSSRSRQAAEVMLKWRDWIESYDCPS